jgi:hypothetical protein
MEQQKRKAQGLPAKLRPISNGPCKLTQNWLSDSPSAQKRVRDSLQPIKLGLGASGGPITMGLIAQASYNGGSVIIGSDHENAFGLLKR